MPSRSRLRAPAFAALAFTAIGLGLAPASVAASPAVVQLPRAAVSYRLPFEAGQSYPVTQGWHGSYSHTGLSAYAYDFGLPEHTPVVAAAAGVVAFVENGFHACGGPAFLDAANSITIDHADGTATLYAHLSRISVHVGQVVAGGQLLGLSGNVGFTGCQAHLHFAREAQGKVPVTQSQPVYFVETGHRQIPTGALATSDNPVCTQAPAGLPDNAFCASYASSGQAGLPPVVRLEPTVDIEPSSTTASTAATASGASAQPGPIAATWVGQFTFADAASYTFLVASDHDVRLSIDGNLIVDSWGTSAASGDIAVSQWLAAGPHVIRLDYLSGAHPLLRLAWIEARPQLATRTIF